MKNILQSALISVILMILWPSWLFSQPESVRWVKSAGGSLDDQATNVAVDGNRNTVVVGFYQGTATFGDTSLAPFGDLDIFIAKYDLEGKLLWVQRAGGASEDKANSVAFDQQGNIFVSGSFDDTVVFGNTTLTAHNSGNPVTRDFFVAKFNPDGDLMWVQQTDASTGTQFALGVAVDSQGNCVVTGLFWISITIGGTTLTEAVSNAQDEIFVFKCDPDGNVLWAKSAGGPGADIGFDIITDSDDNILLTGWSARKVDFGSGVQLTSNSNSEDIFIAKYDKNGNIAWAKNAGSSGEDRGFAIASLGTDFYITGKFQNTIEFDSSHVRFSNGGDDIFAAKYDGSGTLQWLNTAGGSGDDQGRGIAVNKIFSDVELFVTGSFNDRVDFGRDALTSDGADDIFLASYDNFDGDDNWAEQSGGSQTDLGIAVAATPGGNGIVAGLFSDRAQFLFRSATSNGG
ncbi:MAG: SBBP repeat-containing protein, partial [bacterium]